MKAKAYSVCLTGLDAHLISVEVDSGRGLPKLNIVGLPSAAVRETRVRVQATLSQLGIELNKHVITVNLEPAHLRKTGGAFDLAIAIAILASLQEVPTESLSSMVLLGELSLSGVLRPVRGVLPSLMGALEQGITRAIVSTDNGAEAASLEHVESYIACSLGEVAAFLKGIFRNGESIALDPLPRARASSVDRSAYLALDLADVRGQQAARTALEVAAAGGHNCLMMGPPGSGKTMLARRLPTILPPMSKEEALSVTAIHSVAGVLPSDAGLLQERPFRAPHHTISAAALLGGGDPLRPGEASLAHNGCLFLDELLELRRAVIEGLCQPLEQGELTICRARARVTFPARFMLVAALNPCPCGYAGDQHRRCRCSPERVHAYRARLSGPLLDHFDLHLLLPPVEISDLRGQDPGESSASVAERVAQARALQAERYRCGETHVLTNAELSKADLDRVAAPDPASAGVLREAVERIGLSAHGGFKLRRVARTFADLEGSDGVRKRHHADALRLMPHQLDQTHPPVSAYPRATGQRAVGRC